MVYLVEDWEAFEKNTGESFGVYQLLEVNTGVEVRIHLGKFGFRREFETAKDPLLIRILAFCGRYGYVRISEDVSTGGHFH